MSALFFLDRSRRKGRHLEWKVRIFSVAAVLGLAGIYFEERWMTLGAIGLLVAGLALRFLPGPPDRDDDDEDDGDHDGDVDEEV